MTPTMPIPNFGLIIIIIIPVLIIAGAFLLLKFVRRDPRRLKWVFMAPAIIIGGLFLARFICAAPFALQRGIPFKRGFIIMLLGAVGLGLIVFAVRKVKPAILITALLVLVVPILVLLPFIFFSRTEAVQETHLRQAQKEARPIAQNPDTSHYGTLDATASPVWSEAVEEQFFADYYPSPIAASRALANKLYQRMPLEAGHTWPREIYLYGDVDPHYFTSDILYAFAEEIREKHLPHPVEIHVETTIPKPFPPIKETVSFEPQDRNSIMIILTDDGLVLHDGKEIGVSGVGPLVKSRLQVKESPVIILTGANAKTETLVQIVDEAKLAGAMKVSITIRQHPMNDKKDTLKPSVPPENSQTMETGPILAAHNTKADMTSDTPVRFYQTQDETDTPANSYEAMELTETLPEAGVEAKMPAEPVHIRLNLDIRQNQTRSMSRYKYKPLHQKNGTVEMTVYTADGKKALSHSLKFMEKQWADDWPAFTNNRPGEQWIIGRSDDSCVTEDEARWQALHDASDKLNQLVYQRSPEVHDSITPALLQNNDNIFIADTFVQSFYGSAGPIVREALLINASPENLNSLDRTIVAGITEGPGPRQQTKMKRNLWLDRAVSVLGMMALITGLYVFLNFATRGYYSLTLRIGAIIIVAAGLAIVLFLA